MPARSVMRDDCEIAEKLSDARVPASIVDCNVVPSISTSPEPPNGGFQAWMQVLGAFLIFFNCWGLVISFGAFQFYYESDLLHDYSTSSITWIGTLDSALLSALGIIAGPLFDLGHLKSCLLVGSFLAVFAVMMLSLSTQYYQVLLSQGLCLGLGCGMIYIPSLALMNSSFTTRRSIATGIATAGIPLGGVIYTIVFQQLIDTIGFGWTVRVIGLLNISCYAIAIPSLLAGPKRVPGKARALFDSRALKDIPYLIFTSSNLFILLGYMVPLFFLPLYAQVKLRSSLSMSIYFLVIAQAGSLLGRLVTAVIAQRLGIMVPWIFFTMVAGILCFTWIPATTPTGFGVFCGMYGFFSGPLIALPPAMVPVICPDLRTIGTRMGMCWGLWSLSALIGSPIGGALVNVSEEQFIGMQVWSGATLLFGGAQLLPLWYMVRQKSGKWLI